MVCKVQLLPAMHRIQNVFCCARSSVQRKMLFLRKLSLRGLCINSLTLRNTKLPVRPDTIWLGNIPFALTLTMLSHALQIMGAMYYLCFETFEGTEGCLLPQSKCEITKHVTTGSAEVRSNGSSSWQRGLNRMLDRLAMTNVNQNLSLSPIESDPSWTFQLLTPKQPTRTL